MIAIPDPRYIENNINYYCEITPIELSQRLTAIGVSTEFINLFASKYEAKFQRGEAINVMFYTKEFEEFYTDILKKMWGKPFFILYIILSSSVIAMIYTVFILKAVTN